MPYRPQTPAPSFLLLCLGRGAQLFCRFLLPPAGGSVHSIIRRMKDESWGPRLANPFAEARRQGCATDGHPRVPARCARQWTRRAGRGRVWSRQDLGCPGTCGSHTLNALPTLQGPSPGQRRRGCAFTPPHAPPLAPPIIEGSTPVGWPLRGLQPLVRVPTRLTLGPIQPTQRGEGGESGGCSVGQGGHAWQVSSVPYICLSVWVRMGLMSVPSDFSLSACVLVSACLLPSISLLLFANLPHLLCSLAITPGQECYLIPSWQPQAFTLCLSFS